MLYHFILKLESPVEIINDDGVKSYSLDFHTWSNITASYHDLGVLTHILLMSVKSALFLMESFITWENDNRNREEGETTQG